VKSSLPSRLRSPKWRRWRHRRIGPPRIRCVSPSRRRSPIHLPMRPLPWHRLRLLLRRFHRRRPPHRYRPHLQRKRLPTTGSPWCARRCRCA